MGRSESGLHEFISRFGSKFTLQENRASVSHLLREKLSVFMRILQSLTPLGPGMEKHHHCLLCKSRNQGKPRTNPEWSPSPRCQDVSKKLAGGGGGERAVGCGRRDRHILESHGSSQELRNTQGLGDSVLGFNCNSQTAKKNQEIYLHVPLFVQ